MKQTTKIVTFVIIPLLVLAVLIFDVIAIIEGGTEASISSLIIKTSYEMPFFTWSMGFIPGVLVGHLFWRMKSNKDTIKFDPPRDFSKDD